MALVNQKKIPAQLYTGSAAAQIDKIAIQQEGIAGFELMSRAGESAFALLSDRFEAAGSMLVMCGSGNNGGDGYIVAHSAANAGWLVTVLAVREPGSEDALAARMQYIGAGGRIVESIEASEHHYDVVIDAILGIGLTESARGEYADWIVWANKIDAFKFSLDVPSGIDADTGNAFNPIFQAELTLSFIVPKIGLMTGPGRTYSGQVMTDDLQIPFEVIDRVELIATVAAPPEFAPRASDSHKGNYGSVFVAGGDNGMLGAVLLAGEAALRCGAGKVTVLSTGEHLDKPALYLPELMSAVFEEHTDQLLQQADIVVLGPGLGLNAWGRQVYSALIDLPLSMVIDADALTLLAQGKEKAQDAQWVLTPHPGEAARLLGISTTEVQADRAAAVKAIASQRNSVCVLKGAGTLIADPQGNTSLCDLGNAGMATAGMGDVLSGIIAAFLGQGMSALAAAKSAVYIHAHAADLAVEQGNELSLLASDVIGQLSDSIRQHS